MLLNCVYKRDGFRLFMNDKRKESDSRVEIVFQTSGQFHSREQKVHRSTVAFFQGCQSNRDPLEFDSVDRPQGFDLTTAKCNPVMISSCLEAEEQFLGVDNLVQFHWAWELRREILVGHLSRPFQLIRRQVLVSLHVE